MPQKKVFSELAAKSTPVAADHYIIGDSEDLDVEFYG